MMVSMKQFGDHVRSVDGFEERCGRPWSGDSYGRSEKATEAFRKRGWLGRSMDGLVKVF